MLQNWLRPISKAQFNDFNTYLDYQFAKCINIYTDKMPSLRGIKIALIGIDEESANSVRKSLYKTSFHFKKLKIADLGNIRKTDVSFLIPVIKELLESQIVPIIIGESDQSTLAQFRAYKTKKQLINMVAVNETINYFPNEKNESYLQQILDSKKSQLFNLGLVAYQTHFTSPASLQYIEEQSFDHARLGMIRSNIDQIEPIIRDADLISFNINVLKQAEAPGQQNPSPSGLLSEEACQLSWYAGMSDKLSSIGFYGYLSSLDKQMQTAQVMAQLIWYFIDGFYNRKNDFPVSTNSLVEYVIESKRHNVQLIFWKSKKSGRWWVQIPVKTKKKHQRHSLLPCSYEEYLNAGNENIPDRFLTAFNRFS